MSTPRPVVLWPCYTLCEDFPELRQELAKVGTVSEWPFEHGIFSKASIPEWMPEEYLVHGHMRVAWIKNATTPDNQSWWQGVTFFVREGATTFLFPWKHQEGSAIIAVRGKVAKQEIEMFCWYMLHLIKEHYPKTVRVIPPGGVSLKD